jgi:hypothetical protein
MGGGGSETFRLPRSPNPTSFHFFRFLPPSITRPFFFSFSLSVHTFNRMSTGDLANNLAAARLALRALRAPPELGEGEG